MMLGVVGFLEKITSWSTEEIDIVLHALEDHELHNNWRWLETCSEETCRDAKTTFKKMVEDLRWTYQNRMSRSQLYERQSFCLHMSDGIGSFVKDRLYLSYKGDEEWNIRFIGRPLHYPIVRGISTLGKYPEPHSEREDAIIHTPLDVYDRYCSICIADIGAGWTEALFDFSSKMYKVFASHAKNTDQNLGDTIAPYWHITVTEFDINQDIKALEADSPIIIKDCESIDLSKITGIDTSKSSVIMNHVNNLLDVAKETMGDLAWS